MIKDMGEVTTELLADVFNRQFSLRKSFTDAKKMIKHENFDLNILFDLLDSEGKGSIAFRDVDRFYFRYLLLSTNTRCFPERRIMT